MSALSDYTRLQKVVQSAKPDGKKDNLITIFARNPGRLPVFVGECPYETSERPCVSIGSGGQSVSNSGCSMKEAGSIPILTYHSIDESRSVISTAPEVFRRQMKRLSETGMRGISLETFLRSAASGKRIAPNDVVLTFDDGFHNFYTTAFPILEQYGFTATVFLVTDHCGKKNDWPGNPPCMALERLMSWSEVRELKSNGIDFGSHTRTHPDLNRLSESRARREIVESKDAIENELGGTVSTFAYPYGKFNESVRNIAAQHFDAACSTNLGTASVNKDLFSLERIDAYYLSRPWVFDSMSSKRFDRYMKFRQTLRNVKGHVAERLSMS